MKNKKLNAIITNHKNKVKKETSIIDEKVKKIFTALSTELSKTLEEAHKKGEFENLDIQKEIQELTAQRDAIISEIQIREELLKSFPYFTKSGLPTKDEN